MDIASHRLLNFVGIKKDKMNTRSFLQLSCANKGIDAINLGNVLHHKLVIYKIPPNFKNQSVPIISMDISHLQQHTYLSTRRCFMISILTISSLSLLIAAVQIPHSYIIRLARLLLVTLTLSLTSSTPLYEMCSSKGLSIVSLNRSTRNIPMDSVEDYDRQWTERLKIGRSLIQIRINKLSGSSLYINLYRPKCCYTPGTPPWQLCHCLRRQALKYCFCVNKITSTAW